MTRSAGAVVVAAGAVGPEVLLLEQVRSTGERQIVAPKGRIQVGESPLAAAVRETREETGIGELVHVGYLGRQSYSYADGGGVTRGKTVDWFLLATSAREVTPRAAEGFVGATWVPLGEAPAVAGYPGFGDQLRRAADLLQQVGEGRLP